MMSAEILRRIFNAVIEEAENNPEFSAKIDQILSPQVHAKKQMPAKRPSNRRDMPVLNPVDCINDGEDSLREKLQTLTDKQLKDIIAYHGMDQKKQAMKWKNRDRLIDLIIEEAQQIASRGNAFRQ